MQVRSYDASPVRTSTGECKGTLDLEVSNLADVHAQRGLPRGRGSLPPEEVAHAQRERLLRAMVGVVAELGYANVRIADVVDRARVSRQSFYAQFADKEECFLAAHADGVAVIVERLGPWVVNSPDVAPIVQLRSGIGAYLDLAANEPEFARCMLIELQASGPAGLHARLAAHRQIAAILQLWHESARHDQPSWPAIPPNRYAAAVGAVHDLLFDVIARGCSGDAPALEDAAIDAVAALLELPVG
jgi:AcrR family transcriptional regulator